MSKKNFKRRKVVLKSSIIVCCEGYHEHACLGYIKSLYHDRSSNFILDLENGLWWSPRTTVEKAIRQYDYTLKIAWIDTDRSDLEIQEAKLLALEHNVMIVENQPCIEREILDVLGHRLKKVSKYKTLFEIEYPNIDLKNKDDYKKILTKELLDSLKGTDSLFGKLIKLSESWEM